MERTKKVEITDLEVKHTFRIRLFNAMEGLDFIDRLSNLIRSGQNVSIKPLLGDLLPLATELTQDDTETGPLSLERAGVRFESPLAILDLAKEILDFQMVFTKNSAIFHKLPLSVQSIFQSTTSD